MSAPEWVLYNARIYTQSPSQPTATSICIRDGRVLAVGGDELLQHAVPSHRIDLGGCCVLPGLTDAHMHFEWFSLGLQRIDADQPSCDQVLALVAQQAQTSPKGSWIRGHGWNHNAWGAGDLPTRDLLDRVAPDHPVFLTAKRGHASWANSRALQLADVSASTVDPADGAIVRDATGRPTGVFLEGASDLVGSHLPQVTVTDVADAMRVGMTRAHGLGITGVHDMDGIRSLRAWQQLRAEDQLRLRVCKTIPLGHLDEAIGCGLTSGFGDEHLWIGGVKIFTDGALGPQTAWMLAPYENDPSNHGMSLIEPEQLVSAMRRAASARLASFVHAIGDRAIRETLDVVEQLRRHERAERVTALRHRIEHVQIIDAADISRLASLDVIASMQPIHATSDMYMVDRFWGPQRAPLAYAFRRVADSGATLAFGSDAPVETIAPLPGIHAAVTRRREDGEPGVEGWQPQEKLSVEAAICAYTAGAARAGGVGNRLGRLAPGFLADLVVLEQDPHTAESMEIAQIGVAATMVGGQWVYRNSAADGFPDLPATDTV
ncbi:MAG: amidohydrolase [Gemmatimonadetes bacterium]|nr:amidohydrolase [Gemmatimonadota bacterium]